MLIHRLSPSAAEVIQVPADASLRIDQSALESLLQTHASHRLVLGTFNAGSNVTGLREDVPGVTRLLHHYKGLVAWDAAAAAPHVASKSVARRVRCNRRANG